MSSFKSKKLVVAVGYFLLEVVVAMGWLSVGGESLEGVRTVVLAYLGGQSFVDSVLSWKGKKKA